MARRIALLVAEPVGLVGELLVASLHRETQLGTRAATPSDRIGGEQPPGVAATLSIHQEVICGLDESS